MKKTLRVHCIVKVGRQDGDVEVFQAFFPFEKVPVATPDRHANLSAFIKLMRDANVSPHRGHVPLFPGAQTLICDFSDLRSSAL